MTRCQNCGATVDQTADFCTSCGAALGNGGGGPGHAGQGGQGGRGGRSRSDQPQGRNTAGAPPRRGGTSRRNLLKYGGAGAAVLAAAGAGWLVLGGGGGADFADGFEEGIATEWRGDTGSFATVSDAMAGTQAARLAFGGGSDVWRSIPSGTPSEISFWWKAGAVSDNEFTVWFHDLPADGEPSMDNAHFGFEVGAGNDDRVVAAPPFQNRPTDDVLTRSPQPGTWYQTRFTAISFEANAFDVELRDRDGELISTVSGASIDGAPTSINAVSLRNHMNWTGAPAFLDDLTVNYASR